MDTVKYEHCHVHATRFPVGDKCYVCARGDAARPIDAPSRNFPPAPVDHEIEDEPLEIDIVDEVEVGVGATTQDFEYFVLRGIIEDAFKFAAEGKGHQRHGGGGLKWEDQRHAAIAKELGPNFAIGQAVKKCYESQGLDDVAAERELLGAMSYMASAIYTIRKGWRK